MTTTGTGDSVLRLHFTNDDLLRTTVAAGPDPLWETVLSSHVLLTAQGKAVFDQWRSHARDRLRQLPREHGRLLRTLAPPRGSFPDFLNPPEAADGLAPGIDAVLSTPRERLHEEIRALQGVPSWLRPLADGEPEALRTLGRALEQYFQAALAPYWAAVRAQAEADRAVRARALLTGGCEALLSTLGPSMRWRRPVLEVDYPYDRDVRLAGRGLRLVPSVFCWRVPITLCDPALPPVLVYPVTRSLLWWAPQAEQPEQRALGNLIGRGRAAALRAAEGGCTTSELARRMGVTLATASEHARTLRESGLVVSRRERNTVLHVLTPLGTGLLAANAARPQHV
ncbi:DUF5937 family protein [Streptomyces sp. NRRL F-5135]|uniref:DUF5937 family protein n=1 Tax=Streptomyces sp. NRRL F-5135 TaxID=1463858 RepID=UPI000A7DF33C|nr:DUF5937 family protein [Streptomyces sp. NRRL F-5135]